MPHDNDNPIENAAKASEKPRRRNPASIRARGTLARAKQVRLIRAQRRGDISLEEFHRRNEQFRGK